MVFLLDDDHYNMPDPELANENGLIAVGGDFEPQRLYNAYCCSIFPWNIDEYGTPMWYSPDPRMVLEVEKFHCPKSLKRVVKSKKFEVRIDTCFHQVISQCAHVTRQHQYGTWISAPFIEAYTRLHELGLAHSFETFCDGKLVGGLYGVSLGSVFCGESMFHTTTDASKVAFVSLVQFCQNHGITHIDAQQETDHLSFLGASPISRKDYIEILNNRNKHMLLFSKWST